MAGQRQRLECIDMASPHKIANAARIREACVSAGFFYIINHGIDQDFITEVFVQSKKFFALPLEEKMKLFRNESQHGYTPFEDDMLDPDHQSRGETKEGFYIGRSIPGSDSPLHGPNQYPPSELLPGWREVMDRYYHELTKLTMSLARLIALALNLDESFFDQPGIIDKAANALRLLHFSAEESNVDKGVFAAGPHCDWGFFTLLTTDGVPGLQICRNKEAVPQVWEDVPPINGAYIVNLGQLLERWSNGLLRATLHRVIGKGVERYSIPFFVNINCDYVVECFSTCCSEDNPPKFPPITSGDHLVRLYELTQKKELLALT